MQSSKTKEKTSIEKVFLKHSFSKYHLSLSLENWVDILFKGDINKEDIETRLGNGKYFMNEDTESWRKLLNFRDLEDDEFNKCIIDMIQKFEINSYDNYGKFLHVTALLLYFSKEKMIRLTVPKIKKIAKENIRILSTKFALEEVGNFGRRSAYGWAYYDEQSEDFNDIYQYFLKEREDAFTKGLVDKSAQLLIDINNQDMDSIQEKFEKEFSYIPVFSSMKVINFVEVIHNFENKHFMYFMGLIEDRYQHKRNELASELKFWRKVDKKILTGIDRKKQPVKYHHLSYFKNNTIKNILNMYIEDVNE